MRIRYATRLTLVALLLMTAGCASESDQAVQVVTSFYQDAMRGDCAAATSYTTSKFQAQPGGMAKTCAILRTYQGLGQIESSPDRTGGPPFVSVELLKSGYMPNDQVAMLVRGPHGLLIDVIDGTT